MDRDDDRTLIDIPLQCRFAYHLEPNSPMTIDKSMVVGTLMGCTFGFIILYLVWEMVNLP